MKVSKQILAHLLTEGAEFYSAKGKEYILKKAFGKHLYELELILKYVNGTKSTILDIGGGLGTNLQTIRKISDEFGLFIIDKMEEYEGINGIENPIGSAEWGMSLLERSKIKLVKEDFWGKSLPFDSQSFEVVTCFDVIEHFTENPLPLFREVKRILKKDGSFIMCAPNLLSTARRGRLLLGRHPYMHFDMWMKEKYDKYYGHYREYTRREYQIMLEKAGFKTVHTFYVSEPTRTKAFNAYHHEQYRRLSLPALGLWVMYLIEAVFPSLRTEVYCTAKL